MLSRVVKITKTESVYVVWPTNMSAMSLLFNLQGLIANINFQRRSGEQINQSLLICADVILLCSL